MSDNPAWSNITTTSIIFDVFVPVALTTGSLMTCMVSTVTYYLCAASIRVQIRVLTGYAVGKQGRIQSRLPQTPNWELQKRIVISNYTNKLELCSCDVFGILTCNRRSRGNGDRYPNEICVAIETQALQQICRFTAIPFETTPQNQWNNSCIPVHQASSTYNQIALSKQLQIL